MVRSRARRREARGEDWRRRKETGLYRDQGGRAQLLRNAVRGTLGRRGSSCVGEPVEQRELAGFGRVWTWTVLFSCRAVPGLGAMAWPGKCTSHKGARKRAAGNHWLQPACALPD